MKLLEDRIRTDGEVLPGGVLKVGKFLNQQMDPALFYAMAEEWKRLYDGCGVNKILTIEASGIGIAAIVGLVFGCPVVFAKKSKTSNVTGGVWQTIVESFTHGVTNTVIVGREFLVPGDKVLIVDDFLANGAALAGMIDLVQQSGAEVAGAAIAIEKAFQPGGDRIRETGVRVESLARIAAMDPEKGIEFVKDC